MKTKVLKLMALSAMMLVPIGAAATSSTDGTPTATLDLQTLVNGAAFQYDGNYLYVHGYGSAGSGAEWISVVGGANQFGTVIDDNDATNKGFKTLTSFTGAASSNITRQLAINASSKSTRYIVYRVTNCTGVKALCNTNSADRQLQVSAYVVTAGTRAAEAEKTGTSDASTSSTESFELPGLTASNVYDIVVNTTATSNIGLGELIFEINKGESASAWEIDFAGWCIDNNWTTSTTKTATLTAQTRYTVSSAAAVFYSISAENASNETVNFDTRFLQARNSSTYVRIEGVNGHGYYVSSDDATTYVMRDLSVGDVMYVAAGAAPTMVGTLVGDKFVCAGTYNFTYGGKDRSLDYTVYQYIVTTAGDQLFTVPGKTYIYKVGMKKAGTLTAGGNGYSTFSQTVPVTFSGATAYIASTSGVSSVTLSEISSSAVIPANTGVIFKAENKGDNITITYSADAGSDLGTNLLQAVNSSTESFASSGTNYVLATNSSDVTQFYSFTTGVTLSDLVSKCYLNVPTTTTARSLDINFGETTGINVISGVDEGEQQSSEQIYNLSGQRVGNNYKGLVIKNGKKMIIK